MSPYALMLFKSQLVESSHYIAAETTPGSGSFSVTRYRQPPAAAGPSQPASTRGPTDDGTVAAEDAGVGLVDGLNLETMSRTTTLSSCSCQFNKFAGLPCRHQLCVLMATQNKSPPQSMFHKRWQLPSPKQQLALTADLLRRQPVARRSAAAGTGLTRDDRRVLLMGQFRAVADLGATSDGLYNDASKGVSMLLTSLQRNGSAGGHVGGAKRNAPATGEGGERGGGTQGLDAEATWEGDECAERPTKQQRGPSVCHGCWKPGPRRGSQFCSQFGKDALPKPKRLRGGGAAAGTATRRRAGLLGGAAAAAAKGGEGEPPSCALCRSVCVETEDDPLLVCDDDTCSTKVFHESCVEASQYDGFVDTDNGKQWICPYCLDQAEVIDEPASAEPRIVGNPPHKRKPGRQQQARRRPVGEPTAGAKRVQYAARKQR